MRRCVPAIVFALLLFTGRTAFADSIVVGDNLFLIDPGGPPIWGGEFAVDVAVGGAFDGVADLITFCVQQSSDINGTDTFTVSAIGTTTDDGDALDDRTAWIYVNYRLDPLGFVSTYTEDGIQAAIWLIEQELDFTNTVFPSLDASLKNNANALITAAHNAVTVDGFVNTNVRIMQLVFPDGTTEAQDLLMLDDGGTTITQIETPEPATLLLVGGGMSALARRRVKGRRIA
jgi:hypothetical protein